MTPIEKILFQFIPEDEFASACRNAFAGQSGVILKDSLQRIAHPLYPPVGKDALETYRRIGRAEIVSLLLRHSDDVVTPSSIQDHASQTDPDEA